MLRMTDESGAPVALSVVSKTDNGYGDNTIVWEPSGIVTNGVNDVSYTVTVNGVSGGVQATYSYMVTLIKP